MKPEDLVKQLKEALGTDLESVLLYGSAAAGDHVEARSDYNVLVVTSRLDLGILKAISRVVRGWVREGNPAPLMFTPERLRRSADVFPIEILDILQSHRVLHGYDAVADIAPAADNLRLELEHELKGKLIQLRERYLEIGGRRKPLCGLMTRSVSTFLVLFRAALRLYRSDVPAKKIDALAALAEYVPVDQEAFRIVDTMRSSGRTARDVDADALFERYLKAIEDVADAVDKKTTQGRMK